jgi:hypothetical protein
VCHFEHHERDAPAKYYNYNLFLMKLINYYGKIYININFIIHDPDGVKIQFAEQIA